jgi:hypothetical protein
LNVIKDRLDYAAIAEVACRAHADGLNANEVVAETFRCSIHVARGRVSAARCLGHPIPYSQTGRNTTGGGLVGLVPSMAPLMSHPARPRTLACDDCDFECPPGDGPALFHHTRAAHGRRPTTAERTPMPTGDPTP